MAEDRAVQLVVRSAEKRDAGRGIARLPEGARSELGLLSGDTVVIEGERPTVAKVWPGTDDVLRIDADTRDNADVTVGEAVTVRPATVVDGATVRVGLASPRPDRDDDELGERIRAALLDRPVMVGQTVRLDGLDARATIEGTDPDGPVLVTVDTTVAVDRADEVADAEETTPASRGTTYEDIGGLDEELEQVRETIERPISEPELFTELGIDPPKGVLLYGPPGTGKTLIARAVAHEVEATFEVISGPEIVSKYKGESAEQLRAVFEAAERNAPAVVFIDELDSIAGRRDEDADMENRVVAQLLTLLDGLEERGRVVVVGATNRVDAIDPALRRGGRFDREIEIGVPGERGRREILEVHTRDMPLAEDVDLDRVAARTHGFVGADLDALVTEAAMAALDRRAPASEGPAATRTGRPPEGELTVTRADFEAAIAAVEPSAMREHVAETPATTFADVGGLEGAKRTLREAVAWPLTYGPLFDATATDPPSGLLLYGPPGTGKTLMARAVAGECEVNFVHVAGPELLDRYVGASEEAVREVFETARQAAPTVVFFDEIDALAGQRGQGEAASDRVVSQLLAELDGLVEHPNVMVLAATNRPDVLDDALLRPGRLEEHVQVPLPDRATRREILTIETRGKPLADDVSLEVIAEQTDGFSGAELAAMVRRASVQAIREQVRDRPPAAANARTDEVEITRAHFEDAMPDPDAMT